MPQSLSSARVFFREFRSQFHTTGSILPSSRFLAAALATHVTRQVDTETPRRIVEVGPGTGPATDHLVAGMGPHDRLDLVEINEQFVDLLKRRFETEPALRAVAERTRILCQPIEELDERESCDVIVSGLPFNNFQPVDVQRILDLYFRMLKPGAYCSFFEYIAIRSMKSVVGRRADRDRLKGVSSALDTFLEHETRRQSVWLNVLPAWVHHVRKPENPRA